jgi:tetratricopeptide (TPR) repeat protein
VAAAWRPTRAMCWSFELARSFARMTAPHSPQPGSSPPATAGATAGGGGAAKAGPLANKYRRPRVDWKAVWPIPVALGAAGLLVTGLFFAVAQAPKDDPGVPLQEAQELFQQQRFTDTLEKLNVDVLHYYNAGKLSPQQQQIFFLLRARGMYGGQERLGVSEEANWKAILDAYAQAKRLGAELESFDTGNLAEAYLGLDDTKKSIELARQLAGVDDARQVRLYERIVAREIRQLERGEASSTTATVLSLLSEMLDLPKLSQQRRAWVVAQQTRLRLASGYAEEAIARLLREVPRLGSMDEESRAEVLYLLGMAYAQGIDTAAALDYLDRFLNLRGVAEFDVRRGEALVAQARIYQAEGNADAARERFAIAREGFRDTSIHLHAVVGSAETAAASGDMEASLTAYQEALELLGAQTEPQGTTTNPAVTFSQLGEKLRRQAESQLAVNDPASALKFAELSQKAYRRVGNIPSGLTSVLATSNLRAADNLLQESMAKGSAVSPVTAAQARGALIDAGRAFREHSRQTVATNFDQSMASLFSAGDAFDRAGDTAAAIEAFSSYEQGAREDYPRKAEAMYRLARVYQSIGELAPARAIYQRLIDNRSSYAALWADKSIVPLARVLAAGVSDLPVESSEKAAADAKSRVKGEQGEKVVTGVSTATAGDAKPATTEKNKDAGASATAASIAASDKALELLQEAVSGSYFGPESPEMFEALAELGALHHARGEYARAVDRLTEAQQRASRSQVQPSMLYKLAESYRKLALAIDSRSLGSEPLATRQDLAGMRTEYLRQARRWYRETMDITTRLGNRATLLDRIVLRNSTFAFADCALMMRDYEQAVQEYARAREQFTTDPSSLLALTQSMVALIQLERYEDAQAMHDRAKSLLAAIPDEVWSDPGRALPMERRHWEAWFAAMTDLEARANQAAASTP